MNKISIVLTSLLITGRLLGQECSCDPQNGESDTVMQAETESGQNVRLRFPSNPISTATNLAFVCAAPAMVLNQAKLWMPSMGHGSSPTKLVAASAGCTRVEKVNFLMHGDWEMRLKFSNDDTVSLPFPVVQGE